jgi:hypothetical protein
MTRVAVSNPVVGIVGMQVCAVLDASDEEILALCNRENPSGTTQGWTTVHREACGPVAPVVCASDATRLHLLVSC